MKFRRVWGILPLLLVWAPDSASAQDKLDTGDTAWILISTGLVLFMMIPGLAMFYAGLVRTRNVLSVYMHCFGIAALITVLWTLFGYSLAFTAGNPFIGSLSKVFLSGVSLDSLSGTIPELLFFVFQMTFAIITPGLIVGAFAERMKFSAVLWFSGLWCVLVYLPITHMVWGEGGYLGAMGVFDFAGGIVVHIAAG
ncbi:MAG: ammonia channel protein, partial [Gemmatimonadetes bacterium]|nr:ammonia channel protein [Gemmatimonadota bacterium]